MAVHQLLAVLTFSKSHNNKSTPLEIRLNSDLENVFAYIYCISGRFYCHFTQIMGFMVYVESTIDSSISRIVVD